MSVLLTIVPDSSFIHITGKHWLWFPSEKALLGSYAPLIEEPVYTEIILTSLLISSNDKRLYFIYFIELLHGLSKSCDQCFPFFYQSSFYEICSPCWNETKTMSTLALKPAFFLEAAFWQHLGVLWENLFLLGPISVRLLCAPTWPTCYCTASKEC